jgi:probable HAF family extracellular repeat protein
MKLSITARLSIVRPLSVLALLILAAPGLFAQTMYSVIDLGTLGGNRSIAHGINNSGQVVGSAYITSNGQTYPFLYSGGSMSILGVLPGAAYHINDSGQVVGKTADYHAFLYSEGSMSELDTSQAIPSTAYDINDNGLVAGDIQGYAFLYNDGFMDILSTLGSSTSGARGINNNGQMAGWVWLPFATVDGPWTSQRAIVYSGGVMTDLGTLCFDPMYCYGQGQSGADAINDTGQVVGFATNGEEAPDGGTGWYPEVQHAFLYSGGSMIDLGTLVNGGGVGFSEGTAINNKGWVVGFSTFPGGLSLYQYHAFLYDGQAMRDLNDLIPANSGWTLQSATGINDSGQIVGYGINPFGQTHAFLLTSISVLGIDVSHYQNDQGPIGWTAVKNAGKSFALVQATQGKTYQDASMDSNAAGADGAGLCVGVYHLARPDNNPSATDEAENFLSWAGDFIGDGYLPPALDLEPKYLPLNKAALSQWVRTWLHYVEQETGVKPMIYTVHDVVQKYLESDLAAYPLWITTYPNYPNADAGNIGSWSTWTFQQYRTEPKTQDTDPDTTTEPYTPGTCPGIVGYVDLDSFNGGVDALYALTVHPLLIKFTGVDGDPIQPPSNGQFQLQLSAPGAQQVTVQSSTDMITWTDASTVTITHGTGVFTDTEAGTHTQRFYRPKP